MAQDLDSKEGLLRDLEAEWEGLLESLKGLSDEALLEPNVVGAWSLKDLQGHITSWEEETLQMVQEQLAGQQPNFQPHIVDEWNAAQVERRRPIPLGQVQATFHSTHQRLMELTSQLPEDLFLEMTRVRLALEADCWGHYREHRRQVDTWRHARLG